MKPFIHQLLGSGTSEYIFFICIKRCSILNVDAKNVLIIKYGLFLTKL